MRLHSTTLYASLFRYDDDLLVNPHAYGEPASANPTFHFRRLDGGTMAEHYLSSFERVWTGAVSWSGADATPTRRTATHCVIRLFTFHGGTRASRVGTSLCQNVF